MGNNTPSKLYHIHDAQHLLQLNNTSSLPVYESVAGQNRTTVHVSIDSGATDNYVSSDIVSSLRVDKTERVSIVNHIKIQEPSYDSGPVMQCQPAPAPGTHLRQV